MGYIVTGPDGTENGPVELETLVQWAQAGQLPVHAPVRDMTTGLTTTAGQMTELHSLYPAPNFSNAPAPSHGGSKPKGSAMIPTGNPDALWGYYLGIGSLPCVLGLFVAPFAFVKSVRGWKAYKKNPEIHGAFHSVTGIVLATIGTLINIGIVVMFFVSLNAPVR